MSYGSSEIPTYVVSFGGCGSKLMTKLLYPSAATAILDRAHVHWRNPPRASSANFVYVFGDPRNTVISFFQRRKSRHARHGFLPGDRMHEPQPDFVTRAMRNLESPHAEISPEWGLHEYLENSRSDVFELEDHFRRWRGCAEPSGLWFVNYEALWSAPEVLERHLNIDRRFIPPRAPRRADWRLLETTYKQRLNALYGAFAEELAQLPMVFRADW